METERQYTPFRDLLERVGLVDTVRYKILELRDRYPLFNNVYAEIFYTPEHSAIGSGGWRTEYDNRGRLIKLDSEPPEMPSPIDSEDLPHNFASSLARILKED